MPADDHGLGDDLRHRQPGVDAGIGVLEDDLHLGAVGPHLLFAAFGDVLPLEEDLPGRGLDEPQDGPPQGGFSAAGLPHHTQGVPLVDAETDVVHRVEEAVFHLEIFFQVPCFQQRDLLLFHIHPPHLSWRKRWHRMRCPFHSVSWGCSFLQISMHFPHRGEK